MPKKKKPAPGKVPVVARLTDDEVELFERARDVNLPIPVVRLLRAFERAVPSGAKYAVGGGIAVAVHGYRRMTADLDVFASPTAARGIARSLHDAGMTVEGITEDHLIAYFPKDNAEALARREWPEHRIDLLAAVTEPESSAIATAGRAEYAGASFAVMSAEMLVAMKFMAGRPQDLADVNELLLRGAVDVERVRYLVFTSESDRKAAAFARVVRDLRRVKEKGARYVQRADMQAAFAQRRPFVDDDAPPPVEPTPAVG